MAPVILADMTVAGSIATRSAPRSRAWMKQVGLLAVVLLIATVLSFAGHQGRYAPDAPNRFLNASNLVENVATPMSYYAIMGVGLTIVVISGGIDISVGSMMALSAILTAWAVGYITPDASAWRVLPIAMLMPVVIGTVCGLINGLLIVSLRIHPFIVTLGTLGIFRCLVNVLPPQKTMPAQPSKVPFAFTDGFMRFELHHVRIMPMVVMLIVVAVGALYLRYFVIGVNTYAVGGNEEAARLSGIKVGKIKVVSYAISGLCAGIAGMVTLGDHGTANATTATGYELTVVAAAVVGGASLAGGRGTAISAMLGAIVIGLIENGIAILRLKNEYSMGIVGASIIIAVAIDRLSEALSSRSR